MCASALLAMQKCNTLRSYAVHYGATVIEGLQAGAASASAGASAVVAAGRGSVLAISGVGFNPAARYFCHVWLQDGTAGKLSQK